MNNFLRKIFGLLVCIPLLLATEVHSQVIPIADARATADGGTVTVRGIVTRAEGRLTYIQDETAAIPIFESNGPFRDAVADGTIQAGDTLEITGDRSTFNTLEQINPTNFSIINSDNPLPAPQLVTIADILADGESLEAELIRVEGLTTDAVGLWAGSTSYDVADATGTLVLRTPSSSDTRVDGLSIPADTFDFEGVLGVFRDAYQLSPVDEEDIQAREDNSGPGEIALITIAEARAAAEDDTVNIKGIVTRAFGRIAYVQDETAAIPVFQSGGPFRDAIEAGTIQVGDSIMVLGLRAEFATLEQVAPLSFEVLNSGNDLPAPQVVTVADILADGESFEAELLQVDGLTVGATGVWESSTSYDATDATGTMTLRVPSGVDNDLAGEAIPFGSFTFTGVLGVFNDTYQLNPVLPSDITSALVEPVFTLTILHHNDGESQLISASGEPDFGGAARFKTLMDQLKTEGAGEARGVVAVTSGDNFLAGPEFSASLAQDPAEPYYDAVLFDSIGYDALCIGNHDFDFGPDVLAKMINDVSVTQPPFLSANLDVSGEPLLQALEALGRIAPSTVVTKNGQDIGIIGATTPNLPFISSPGNVVVNDMVAEAIQTQVDQLTAQGVSKIIVISHLQGVEEDLELAASLRNVDVIIAGGGDELLANEPTLLVPGDEIEGPYPRVAVDADGKSVPVVTTAGDFKYIGRLEVGFDEDGNVVSIGDNSGPVRVSGVGDDAVVADPVIQANVVDPISNFVQDLAENVIGSTEPALDGLRSSIRSIETNQGNLIADAFVWQANVLAADFDAPEATVGIANGGGIRDDAVIPAGSDITELKTFDILPFSNFITIVEEISPAQFKEIMENCVSRVDGTSGTGRFGQISGFSIEYTTLGVAQQIEDGVITTPGTRIRRITLDDGTQIVANGAVVDGAPNVNVATADFLARGGDQYPFGDAEFTLLGVTYQQALANYITDALGGTITAADYPEGGEGRITEVGDQGLFKLTVLHHNDGESQLIASSNDPDFGGAARFKTLMDQLKAQGMGDNMGVVTLTSGDNFLAGPEFSASLAQDPTEPYYDAVLFDSIGYDALAIGNHDFDFGPEVLAKMISDISVTQPPFLSANLDFSGEPSLQALVTAGRIAPSTVINVNGMDVGVVGATTPNLPFISSPGAVEVGQDVAAAVQPEVDALLAQDVDMIIVISHLQGVEEDAALANALTDVDIIIAGGGDELLANEDNLLLPGDEAEGPYPRMENDADGNPVYIVTTSGDYEYIGRLGVFFDENGKVVGIEDGSGPVRVSGVGDDAVVADPVIQANVVDPISNFVQDLAGNVIGSTEPALDGLRSSIRSVETNQGNLIADAFVWQANQLAAQFGAPPATVGIANGGGIRDDAVIPAGSDITELKTFDILPFSNFITIVEEISPAQFKEIIENCVSRVDGGSGTGRFGQISGFSFEYTTALPAQQITDGVVTTPGARVRTITLDDGTPIVVNGQVVDGAPNVNVATADFLARGGDQYPFGDAEFTLLGVTYQQALANYIIDALGGTITAADYPEGGEGRIVELDAGAFFTLTLLHNNDGESQLISASGQPDFGGAARFKTLMDQLRAEGTGEGRGVLALTSGDNFLAGPEFSASLNRDPSEPYYDAILFDSIGYDALCIGNHDFDFGPEVLAKMISDVSVNMPPFLSANLDFSGEPSLQALVATGRIAPSVVLNANGEDIGVIGATTPNLASISSPGGVVVNQDVAAAVQAQVDALLGQGINKIVLISHLQGIDEDLDLAAELTDVDIIIAGGGDELLANEGTPLVPGDEIAGPYPREVVDAEGDTVYVVTGAGDYKYIGRLVATFDEAGEVINIDLNSGPVRVSGVGDDAVAADAGVQENVVDPILAYVDDLENNIIGSTEVALDGRRSTIRFEESNQGNLIADAFLWQSRELADDFGVGTPDVALANGGGIRNDNVIPAGSDISELTTFDILPFPNFLSVFEEIEPQHFKEIMENTVSRVDTSSGTGRFAQIAGFELVYDSTATRQLVDENGNITQPGNRVVSITLDDGTEIVREGQVVEGAPNVNLTTVDFLARGGDQYPFRGQSFTILGVTYQQALFNYITQELGGTIAAADYPEGGEGRILIGMITSIQDVLENTQRFQFVAFPNPAQDAITFAYELNEQAKVALSVFNLMGQEVAALQSAVSPVGKQEIRWNLSTNAGATVNPGIYFVRLEVDGQVASYRITITR